MKQIIIRKCNQSDADELSKLICKTLRIVNSKDYEADIIDKICQYYSEENLRCSLLKKTIYVAVEEKKIVGSVAVSNNKISTVFVESDCLGQGIGKKLMEYAEEIISKSHAESELSASITALKFYEKLGYCVIKRIATEFGKNYLMEKNLTSKKS